MKKNKKLDILLNAVTERLQGMAKLKAGSGYTMGLIRDGESEPEWPEPKGWEASPSGFYGHNSYDRNSYQNYKNSNVFVKFDAANLTTKEDDHLRPGSQHRPSVKRALKKDPGTYEVIAFGKTSNGTWSHEKDIPKILAEAEKMAEREIAKMQKQVEGLKRKDWTLRFDGTDLRGTYPSVYDDTNIIDVEFEYVDEVLGSGEPGEANITFTADIDMGGSRGVKEMYAKFASLKDIEKVLKTAEAFHKKHAR